MFNVLCLTSAIWSGFLLTTWLIRGHRIYALNILWFAVSIAGLTYGMGWIR